MDLMSNQNGIEDENDTDTSEEETLSVSMKIELNPCVPNNYVI